MMVENFGSYLKHERELRGVPLEEISGATKIHIRYLKALEENSFDELPGEVFIKGYIRSYANIIGSDVEEMLNIYKESVELKKPENVAESTSGAQPKTLFIYGLMIVVTVGLLFSVGVLIKNGVEEPSGKLEENKMPILPTMQTEDVEQEPLVSPGINLSEKQLAEDTIDAQELDSSKSKTPALIIPGNLSDQTARKEDLGEKTISALQESMEPITQSLNPALPELGSENPAKLEKPLKLLIRADEISWFNMTIDDFREEDFILPAGTEKIFWGNDKIRLTVGNKTGVELFLNGNSLTLPASEDRVVKDFIINSKLVE
jgi:cytoskeleton protein RodZ